MSDNNGYCKSCEKLTDEIERLQKIINDLNSGWQSTYDYDTTWLKSEIERLRDDPEYFFAFQNGWNARNAEIERLRLSEVTALKALANTDENCRARFAEYRAEIKLLKKRVREALGDKL